MNGRTIARLVRLPNLPTAVADVALAGLAVTAAAGRAPLAVLLSPAFWLLGLASAALYTSGMAFNDYFDADEDRRERPERPIPSGEATRGQALTLALALMASGLVLAALAGFAVPPGAKALWLPWPIALAVLLAGAILAYDAVLKQTILGPLGMGACRSLNVLMGASFAGAPGPLAFHLASVVGLYVVGLTWFAKSEATHSKRPMLTAAAAVMLCALLLALTLPEQLEGRTPSPLFVYLLVGLGFFVGLPVVRAMRDPNPARVQAGVVRCLMGLILLDGVLATAAAGTAGLVVLALMGPSLYLNRKRWLYAT